MLEYQHLKIKDHDIGAIIELEIFATLRSGVVSGIIDGMRPMNCMTTVECSQSGSNTILNSGIVFGPVLGADTIPKVSY